jgi:hypothetical protein
MQQKPKIAIKILRRRFFENEILSKELAVV